jgi:hypothetical protein
VCVGGEVDPWEEETEGFYDVGCLEEEMRS